MSSIAIRAGSISSQGARPSSPGVGKGSAPETSFASTLADQVAAQAPRADDAARTQRPEFTPSGSTHPASTLQSHEHFETSLASQSLVSQPSLREAAKPAAQSEPAPGPQKTAQTKDASQAAEPVENQADTRAADEHALDTLALSAREPAPAAQAAPPAKTSAKPGTEKSSTSAKAAAAPIAQASAQSGIAQLASRVNDKKDASPDSDAGAESSSSKGAEPTAARKVAAFVFKGAPAGADAQAAKPPPTATSAAPSTTDSSAAKPAAELSRPAAVPFAHEADGDPSLHVSLLPQAAHLRMDVDGVGDLSLHLRMQDGQAHITVSGAAAPLVEARSSDLRSALAGQGLSLGHLEQVTASSSTSSSDAGSQQLSQDGGSQPQDRNAEDRGTESRKSATSAAARNSSAFTISRSVASASGKR